ncbi:hypothetical protein [uncultured Veillonella sp.]|uniref:hypothetical protein n=1 Tax=uncultured Veillonella sp. TaxID=159268 RepID=UPI0028D4513A|nr:hypothetical protein [uncultured Veillonella sp.]
MKLKGLILVVTALAVNIGITNAEQVSTPSVGTPLGTKIIQVDRTQSLEVMPYMESKVMGETELSYAVMSRAKKTFDEQMLEHRDAESRMHAHIEEYNSKIKSVPQRDLIKNPYTREEIEKQIVDAINFRESIKYPINDKEYYNHIDVDKVNDLSGFPKKIPSFAKQVDIHLKPPKAIEDGRYIQVSFTGKPSELKPYIQDAENHAKVVITKGEAERVSIKPYENVKTNYRKYLSTILPEEWIEVTNTYNNMYQYKVALSNENIKQKVDHELANQMNNQMFMGLEQDTSQLSSDKVLSNDENKALQKIYLGYYSYKEVNRPFEAGYTFYIFKFDYLYNSFTVAGMAVNPEQTRVIYFLHTVQ